MKTIIRTLLLPSLLISSTAIAVVGGKPAGTDDAPWVAALIDVSAPIGEKCVTSGGSSTFCQHYCGGVLISPEWVLTAGHCLIDRRVGEEAGDVEAPNVRVLLDTTDLNILAPDFYSLQTVITRPEWEDAISTTYEADIALLRLDRPAEFIPVASLIDSALLNSLETATPPPNDSVHVFGWGRLRDNGPFPNLLQRVAIDLRPNDCSSPLFVASDMICAGESTPYDIEADDERDVAPRDPDGEGACERDSGGPLVHFDGDAPYVGGLVSWGHTGLCGSPNSPTTFTRIPRYLQWIEQQTANAGDPLVNLAVEIDAPNSTSSHTETVTVTLTNRSLENAVTGASFTFTLFGDGDLLFQSADTGLVCVALDPETSNEPGYECSVADAMVVAASYDATFLASGLAEDNLASLTATATADQDDYATANRRNVHHLARTEKPGLQVDIRGVVAERINNTGRLWLFVTVSNTSDHVTATGVTLTINAPADHVLFGDGGLECDLETLVCQLDDLAPGEVREIPRIELASPGTNDGVVIFTLSAVEGNFPTSIGPTPTASAGRSFNYPASTNTPQKPAYNRDWGNGFGSVPAVWLLFMLLLLGRGRRH
jgi:secreted trypsin-like serine protease